MRFRKEFYILDAQLNGNKLNAQMLVSGWKWQIRMRMGLTLPWCSVYVIPSFHEENLDRKKII